MVDANGRQIAAGSRVRCVAPGAGGFKCTVTKLRPPVQGLVAVVLSSALPRWAEKRSDGTYTCPDLVLLDDNEKEAAR